MKKFLLLICLLGLIFIIPGPALAEEKEKEGGIIKLEEIVVTATKTEKNVEDAPGSVTVISKKEIERRNIKTVDEALSELTGIFVKRTKGLMDSTPSVRVRGFKGDQYTLVLLDGQPLNDSYGGGVEWGMFPVDNIERIEVIRGAASALYGGNAMGGVINIITKTPEKLEASATAGYGTHDTRRYRFSVGDRFADKFSLRIGYEEESTDGYETTPVVKIISTGTGTVSGGYAMNDKYGNPTKWVVGDKGENGAEKSSIDAKATFDFSDTGSLAFTTVLGRHEYDYGPPNTYMGTFGDNTEYPITGPGQRTKYKLSPNNFISYTGIGKNETDIYTLAFENSFDSIKLHAQVGTTKTDDRYTLESGGSSLTYYDSPGTLKITENESWFSEVRADVPLGESHLLTVGVSYRTDESDTDDYDVPFYRSYSGKSDSTFYSGGKDKIWAVFVQDEWNIAEPLTLYLGGRYDTWKVCDGASGVPGSETKYDSNTESEFSPKASVVWKALSDTTLKASVGHAFRPPNLYELYRTWTTSGGTTKQSNPNLGPETVWTYEAGVDQYLFSRKTRLSLTGYRNDIEDLIYYKIDGTTKTRTNAGEARTYGLEFGVSQEITEWLKAWGNYTWTQAEITDNPTDPDSEDKRIAGIPKTTFNIGLDAEHKWFRGSLVGRYFSKIFGSSNNNDTAEGVYQTYEPAFYVDGKITISPSKWTDISLSVDNILDKEYWEYYEGDGRTFFVELTLRY
ncbi:MAG: TonB-dependent receptor [Spirochaetales bacterium]|jgi:iron complex outermembrane receptor protein|nr:TonB-dependent receptor [Spirochaetales bacterium]